MSGSTACGSRIGEYRSECCYQLSDQWSVIGFNADPNLHFSSSAARRPALPNAWS